MRPIKRKSLNPDDKFRLNVMLSERLGAKLRKQSEETLYSQSAIIAMALEAHFSPAQEDERMAIVNDRLEYLAKSVRMATELLPSTIKAELADDFAKIDRKNQNEQYLQDIITDLRRRLAQSEKLRGEGRKTITELQNARDGYKQKYEEYSKKYQDEKQKVDKLGRELKEEKERMHAFNKWYEAEKKTIGGKINRFFYDYIEEEKPKS